MKKFFNAIGNFIRNTPMHVIIIAAALLLMIGTVITMSAVLGKYTTEERMYGTFSVSNRLASRFALQEHEAVQGEDGSYTLDMSSVVINNSYQLIPGLTIPKDPYISVENKTSVPAYIYFEVVEDNVSSSVSYSVNGTLWTLLSGVTGPNGGAVYTYSAGLVDDTSAGLDLIPILSDNSFSLPPTPITGEAECLKFYGYMIEPTTSTATAEATFTGTVIDPAPHD